MAKEKVKRQVLYNLKPNPREGIVKWIFMVVGTSLGIDATEEEVHSQFERVISPKDLYITPIESSKDLYAKFFLFSASAGRIEQPERIHAPLRLDKNLIEGDDVYCERFLQDVLKGRLRK